MRRDVPILRLARGTRLRRCGWFITVCAGPFPRPQVGLTQRIPDDQICWMIPIMIMIHQDLSYGEILAGRPEAWLVKKNLRMQSQKFKKDLIFKFKIICRTCFVFMIALMVYE